MEVENRAIAYASTWEGIGWDTMYSSWSPCIKHVVSKLGYIECYNLYYKYVNKVDKLTSIFLTPIGEEPNP